MNQLLLLEDRVNVSTERCGVVIVKRDIPFKDIKVDVGFKHKLKKDYQDEDFYSIPILDFLKLGYENPAEVERQILEQCAAHASKRLEKGVVGKQRFLVRYAGSEELVLTEVSTPEYQEQRKGRLSVSRGYWRGSFQQLAKRIPDFADNLQRAEQKFETVERLNRTYRVGR